MAGRGPLWSALPNPYIHLLNAPHYEFILSFIESQKLIWHKFHCKALETLISKVMVKQNFVSIGNTYSGQMMKYRLIYRQWTFFRNGSDLVNTLFCIYLSFYLQNSKHFPTQGLLVPRPVLPACRVVRQKVTGCGTGVGRGLGLPACGPGVSPQTVLVHCGGEGRFPLIFPICASHTLLVGGLVSRLWAVLVIASPLCPPRLGPSDASAGRCTAGPPGAPLQWALSFDRDVPPACSLWGRGLDPGSVSSSYLSLGSSKGTTVLLLSSSCRFHSFYCSLVYFSFLFFVVCLP